MGFSVEPLNSFGTSILTFEKESRKMTETLQLRGTLEGHAGWVTQIATNPKYPDIILSACQWLGLLMVRRYLPVTLITLFASGKSPSLLPAKIPTVVLLCI